MSETEAQAPAQELPPVEVVYALSEVDRRNNLNELKTLVSFYLTQEWVDMFNDPAFIEDTVYEGTTYLGLRNAPAAKANHHHYHGGLVQHYLEMWKYFLVIKDALPEDQLITPERVLAGIILHDLSKAWCAYHAVEGEPTKVTYGKHPSDYLLTADQKSAYIAAQFRLPLDIYQWNALYHSEGGWAKAPPRWCSPLAKLLYLLDEMSGNLKARIEQIPAGEIGVMGDKGVMTMIAGEIDLSIAQPLN